MVAVLDSQELALGEKIVFTDPSHPDTDGVGLPDGQERYTLTYRTGMRYPILDDILVDGNVAYTLGSGLQSYTLWGGDSWMTLSICITYLGKVHTLATDPRRPPLQPFITSQK